MQLTPGRTAYLASMFVNLKEFMYYRYMSRSEYEDHEFDTVFREQEAITQAVHESQGHTRCRVVGFYTGLATPFAPLSDSGFGDFMMWWSGKTGKDVKAIGFNTSHYRKFPIVFQMTKQHGYWTPVPGESKGTGEFERDLKALAFKCAGYTYDPDTEDDTVTPPAEWELMVPGESL